MPQKAQQFVQGGIVAFERARMVHRVALEIYGMEFWLVLVGGLVLKTWAYRAAWQ